MICPYFSVQRLEDISDFLETLTQRINPDQEGVAGTTEEIVLSMLHDVKKNGLEAVIRYTRQYDSPCFSEKQFLVPKEQLESAANNLSQEDKKIILEAAKNIREFHEAQKQNSWFTTRSDGTILGQRVLPVERAGLYIPGGKAGETPLISSLLMNVIPAQVAGVKELALVSPPCADGTISPFLLGAAWLLGISEVYAVGSAWAIAALAYGAGSLKPVEVITGPGNIYVATAKRLLIGTVGIDMIAGPSEILVLADSNAPPSWIAADMLSQAEHDTLASSVCICTNEDVAKKTLKELSTQCETLPRKDIATQSLKQYGAIIYTPSIDVAIGISNVIAPEHLELLLQDPWSVLPSIKNAGAIFMGNYSSESSGDYFAGPNHVLPTMGTARFASALGVETFMKKSSVISVSRSFSSSTAQSIARLARIEGLEAHARSALYRE